jgi:L-threonylcarbamoyladenylate synthase
MNLRTTAILEDVDAAATILRRGGIVAFPTETVFGLGAIWNHLDAIAAIFAAKGRPADNPLIVHIASLDWLDVLARDVPASALALLNHFAPGPLTVVVPRSDAVPDTVTAQQESVAIRIPAHPIAIGLIRSVGQPLVAPSANRSGAPSGTTWDAVRDDLGGRIDGVLKGQPTSIGLESTVVDCTCDPPVVLRPGSIAIESLCQVIPKIRPWDRNRDRTTRSPGLRHRHYSPKCKVIVADGGTIDAMNDAMNDAAIAKPLNPITSDEAGRGAAIGWIGIDPPPSPSARWSFVRSFDNTHHYAQQLYSSFRQADALGLARLYCQSVPMQGIGTALMDRLRRAAEA